MSKDRVSMVQVALMEHFPAGWRQLSTDSLARVLARPVASGLEAAATAGEYTQNHHEGFYAGLRAMRG